MKRSIKKEIQPAASRINRYCEKSPHPVIDNKKKNVHTLFNNEVERSNVSAETMNM
jgi:hypothetical protein